MDRFDQFQCEIILRHEDYIVRDHRVHHVRIMPGVTFLDIIYRILQTKLVPLEEVMLRNILFKEAVATTEQSDKQLRLAFSKKDDGWQITASSRPVKDGREVQGEWTDNLQCELHFVQPLPAGQIELAHLKDMAVEAVDMEEVYAIAKRVNIQHFEFMKGRGRLYKGRDYLLAEIHVSELARQYLDDFYLHPAYLDCSTLIPFLHASDAEIVTPYIPLHIESFQARERLGDICYVYVPGAQASGLSHDIVSSDYELYNGSGQKIASFQRLSAKRIRSKELITRLEDSAQTDKSGAAQYQLTSQQTASAAAATTGQITSPEEMEIHLQAMVARALKKKTEEIRREVSFYDQGLDSRDLLGLVKELEQKIGKQLYPTLLFEYSNIQELAAYLRSEGVESFAFPTEQSAEDFQTRDAVVSVSQPASKLESTANPLATERDIAIIGLAGRYPQSPTLYAFWENAVQGKDCIIDIPRDHWDYVPDGCNGDAEGLHLRSKAGGFIDGVDQFDPLFFGISPREAELLDPQLRLMLQTAWHTVEDAGYTPKHLAKSSVGVYIGVMNHDYTWVAAESLAQTGMFTSPGSYDHEIANRISYVMNLQGPSMTVATACSSSLTAIHLARQAILNGECELALAGGVNLSLHRSKYLMLSGLKLIAPDGVEKTFDKDANGYVPGEGVGLVLLKPLRQAIADRDHIYGVIKGSAVNHSGSGAGHHVPNIKALAKVAEEGIAQAGMNPERIGYVETHGTGTALGDPLELQALANAFGKFTKRKGYCALGTKANFGHLESASGVCSLTKVLLSMKHGKIPSCANISEVNPMIPLHEYPFYIPQKAVEWERTDGPRAAVVNSFGIGGSNSFMVIEEFIPEPEPIEPVDSNRPELIVLSVKKAELLAEYARQLVEFIDQHPEASLASIAYTLQTGRVAMKERLAVVAANLQELKDKLLEFCAGTGEPDRVYRGTVPTNPSKRQGGEAAPLIAKREWARLATMWTEGADINWEEAYPTGKPPRISLPVYPFAKERFWIPEQAKAETVPQRNESPRLENLSGTVFGYTEWRRREGRAKTSMGQASPNILLFAEHDTARTALRDYAKADAQIVLVKMGERFCRCGADLYEINPGNPDDYQQLFDVLQQRNQFPGKIFHIFSDVYSGSEPAKHEDRLQRGFYSIFFLTQALMRQKRRESVQLLYVYTQSDTLPKPEYAAVAGLIKSIRMENPKLLYKGVEFDRAFAGTTEEAASLMQRCWLESEYGEEKDEIEIRYDQNGRSVKVKCELSLHQPEPETFASCDEIAPKRNGAYLITGGAGGIGMAFATYLAKRYKAKLILTGRSSLSRKIEEKLQQLRSYGAQVLYTPADITRQSEVEGLIAKTKAAFGKIDGIIHSAGVIRDALVFKKTHAELDEVLAPKVYGSLLLDEATKDEQLDFFVMFSSTSALLGNVGQADYAFANHFMDHFAKQRDLWTKGNKRYGKTLSINWPLWRDGGMKVDAQTESMLADVFGMHPMSVDTGLHTFETGLKTDTHNLFVIEGETDKIRKMLNIVDRAVPQVGPESKAVMADTRTAGREWFGKVEKDVVRIVSRLLKIREADLDPEAEMSDFGFDSILLTQFSEELSEMYESEILPSIFFEHRTLSSLIDYLVKTCGERLFVHDQLQPSVSHEAEAAKTAAYVEERHLEMAPAQPWTEDRESVAIIGISGVMPQSADLGEFWDHLEQGHDLVTVIPPDRWNWSDFPSQSEDGHCFTSKWGGFLHEIDTFDPLFFGISPREAELMDPQQRIFMEVVWHAIEDAGYRASQLSGTRTAVFVGAATSDYKEIVRENRSDILPQMTTGTSHCVLANRISYFLDLHGPSEPVDTACSSSLVAIHRAVEAIRNGNCEMAIAGGVNIIADPELHISFSKAGMLSADGRCKTFDKGANGYVRGEGAGAILLKPLGKAIADGDHIYAVIRGSEVNHGGRANSLTAPNPNAQADLLVSAYRNARIDPGTVSYIEVHGTGTALGDPIEANGLKKAFARLYQEWGRSRGEVQHCGLGSVKTNIGHLETAAGIAGVLKLLLAFQHKRIPATIHFRKVNPNLHLADSPFYIVDQTKSWDSLPDAQGNPIPRRAGVSSFGFGGVNAHVVLEEYIQPGQQPATETKPQVIVLSAKNAERLKEYALKFLSFVDRTLSAANPGKSLNLHDFAYTLQTGREPMEERLAFVASSLEEVQRALQAYVQGSTDEHRYFLGNVKENKAKQWFRGRAGEEFIKWVVHDQDWEKISEMWVSGIEVDWRVLHRETTPRRISLPTYPFAKEKYWIQRAKTPVAKSELRPLLDAINPTLSLGEGVVFQKELRREMPVVSDHQVAGEPVLPGVAYLEMAYSALEQVNPGADYDLTNVIWLHPLVVQQGKTDVQIVLHAEKEELHYTIQSRDHEERLITHGKGSFTPAQGGQQKWALPINEIKGRTTQVTERAEFYRRFERYGLTYGPYYQGINRVWHNSQEAISLLSLPEIAATGPNSYILHPGIMDAALQTIASFLAYEQGSCRPLRLPFTVACVKAYRSLPQQAYAYVSRTEDDRYDCLITDQHGEVCVELRNIVFKERKDAQKSMFYLPVWQEQSAVCEKPAHGRKKQHILFIYPPHSGGLKKALTDAHAEAFVYEIQTGTDQQGFVSQLERMQGLDMVYFLGGVQAEGFVDEQQQVSRSQTNGVISLFRFIKALGQSRFKEHAFTLKVITNNVWPLTPDESVFPYAASLYGFSKSLRKEYPHIAVSCIDIRLEDGAASLQADQMKAYVASILSESVDGCEEEVLLRGEKRYVRTIKPIVLPAVNETPFRRHGVYLIVGGAGGIGLEVGKHLAKNVQARLILVGRSALRADQENAIREIESIGGQVMYVQADICDLESMKRAVEMAKSRFQEINGVIHSALVLHDKTVEHMDEATLRTVLGPKVAGSVVLHEAFRDEKLDFMMFFSSAQTFVGNAGQSNYAAACSFKDAYAHYLMRTKPYPVKVINWGYWGSVGVVASEEYNKRLALNGVYSIMPAEGMEAIERILTHPVEQIITIKADPARLAALGFDFSERVELSNQRLRSLLEPICSKMKGSMPATESVGRQQRAFRELERFGRELLLAAFQQMGVFQQGGKQYQKTQLAQQLKIIPPYARLFDALLEILAKAKFIEINQHGEETLRTAEDLGESQTSLDVLRERRQRLLGEYPEITAHLELVWQCINAYPHVLTGKQNHLAVMFPNGSKSLVENIYQGNPIADYYNALVGMMVKQYIEQRNYSMDEPIRILEVGAGTGGTSRFVLDAIKQAGGRVEYTYSDISLSFIQHGQHAFGDHYPFARFRVFDLEQEIERQGMERNGFDLIFGSNVFHATKRIAHSLQQVKKLLKANGVVIINEVTQVQEFLTLTFGLADGWWLFQDADNRLPHSPLLSPQKWCELLAMNGFRKASVLVNSTDDQQQMQSILIAESDGRFSVKNEPELSPEPRLEPRNSNESGYASAAAVAKQVTPAAQNMAAEDLPSRTLEYLKREFAQVLKIDASILDHQATFERYGVDSLVVIEMTRYFEKSFGKLPSTLLFEFPTLEKLRGYFLQKHENRLQEMFGLTGESDVSHPVVSIAMEQPQTHGETDDAAAKIDRLVDDLSDREIDELLQQLVLIAKSS